MDGYKRMWREGEKKARIVTSIQRFTLALIRSIEPIRSKPLVNAMYFQARMNGRVVCRDSPTILFALYQHFVRVITSPFVSLIDE